MNPKLSPRRRALSLLLALLMALELLPGAAFAAEEAGVSAAPAGHWAAGYLNQMVEWGFIRADQAGDPDRQLTRADFMAIVNRAYGYNEVGPTPFEDVSEYDWFYDDVGIAYTARYINGTSATTASPNDTLDRESAATILGRNMMLQESAGEILDFTDARDISSWARGTIKSSMEHYLVTGYDDGTFRPQQAMNWGEIAALVTRTIGTPLQDAGDYSLGGVFGNVTVTSPGVTLRDTVVSGDLYITGGVGLGGIKLENVTVLGRIIASGTGTSEGGASILMRNVTADELLVDNLQDKEVSIQADGITEIGKTTVRSSAYIEDNTPDGLGLHMISFEGDWYGEDEEVPEGWEPPKLTLAGRVEEVVNRTPNSTVHAAKGTVAKLTVDEEATDSQVIIDRGTVVKDLVLDTGVNVTGEGDVTKLEVNAPGSNVAMIPDDIYIRPGITTIIAGEEMDSTSAEEFSLEPLILSGYPKAKNIAPTSLDAVFSTNKKGTIHWAVSAINDGSVGVDALLEPPAYGNIALRYGTLVSPRGNEETSITITGLTPDGSYYLSAVLEDARGQVSPLKVISFTTPDNTVPAFNQGYPRMTKTSRTNSQVVVSANKSCVLYYALYAQGATAPTVNDLKTGSVAGSLGYGVRTLEKNTEDVFQINDRTLEEQQTYIVYFWLTDANGANSSAISSLTFTTADETPPYFLQGYPQQTGALQPTSANVTVRISEPGTVYWALVEENDPEYPRPEQGQTRPAPLDSESAKLQVKSGTNALQFGRVTANETADTTFTISRLTAEKTYDLYLVIEDNAGNLSLRVEKITINTLDETRPTVVQSFTDPSSNPASPRVTSGIVLTFSETVKPRGSTKSFLELYEESKSSDEAMTNFVNAIHDSFVLWHAGSNGDEIAQPIKLNVNDNSDDWVIDYTKAQVTRGDGGEMMIIFPGDKDEGGDGLNLLSGDTYFFRIHNVADSVGNVIVPNPVDFGETSNSAGHNVFRFTVAFAEINLQEFILGTALPRDTDKEVEEQVQETDENGNPKVDADGKPVMTTIKVHPEVEPDAVFRMTPKATRTVSPDRAFDLLLWTDTTIEFDLYYRAVDKDGKVLTGTSRTVDKDNNVVASPSGTEETYTFSYDMPNLNKANIQPDTGWVKLGNSGRVYNEVDDTLDENGEKPKTGVSLQKVFNKCETKDYPDINTLDDSGDVYYEFAVYVTWKGPGDRESWSGNVEMDIYIAAGAPLSLNRFANANSGGTAITPDNWKTFQNNGLSSNNGGASIGSAGEKDFLRLPIPFPSSKDPSFQTNYPQLTPEDTTVSIRVNVKDFEKSCMVYYVLAPVGELTTTVQGAAGFQDEQLLKKNNEDNTAADYYSGPYVPENGTTTGDPNLSTNYQEWVSTPAKESIRNGRTEYAAYPLVIADSFEYSGESATLDKVVDGLQPETDYFAYFVLVGDSGKPTKIYLYTFTTQALIKPKIRPNNVGDGTATVDTHVSARGQFQVLSKISATSSLGFMLAKPFYTGYTYTEAATGVAGDPELDGKLIPDFYKDSDFTVLQALSTPYNYDEICDTLRENNKKPEDYYLPSRNGDSRWYDGYSVFDIYASSSARSKMHGLIQSRTPGRGETVPSSVNWLTTITDLNLDMDEQLSDTWWRDEIDAKLSEKDDNVYILLTYAINKNTTVSGTAEVDYASFRAEEIKRTSLALPNFFEGTGTIRQSTGSGVAKRYRADITLTFDMNIYKPGAMEERFTLPSEITPSTVQVSSGGSIAVTAVNNTGFTLSFTNVQPGDYVIFDGGKFANRDGQGAPERLTAEVMEENGQVYIEIRWRGDDEATWTTNKLSSAVDTRPFDVTLTLSGGDGTKRGTSAGGYTYTLINKSFTGDKFTATVTEPSEGTIIYSWTSSNSSVATVSPSNEKAATITLRGAGTATITVYVTTADGGPVQQTIQVTATGVVNPTFAPGAGTESAPLDVTATPYAIAWKRNTGSNPVGTIDLGIDLSHVDGQVTWSAGSPTLVSLVSSNGTRAEIRALADTPAGSPARITATFSIDGQTTSVVFEVTVTGGDTAVGSMLNPRKN